MGGWAVLTILYLSEDGICSSGRIRAVSTRLAATPFSPFPSLFFTCPISSLSLAGSRWHLGSVAITNTQQPEHDAAGAGAMILDNVSEWIRHIKVR